MPSIVYLAPIPSSGRAVADKPILDHHTATGQFVITNYDANLTYNTSVNSGSVSFISASVISLSSADSICTITARLPKSISNSASATAERKTYTTTPTNVDVSYIHGLPQHGVINYGGAPGTRWTYCLEAPYGGECPHQEGTNIKNATPSGYTDSYNEWWKVT